MLDLLYQDFVLTITAFQAGALPPMFYPQHAVYCFMAKIMNWIES